MVVFVLFVIAVAAIVVVVASRKASRRHAFEADTATHPLHPTVAATLRVRESAHWTDRRDAFEAARRRTDDILGVLGRHREALLLVTHSTFVTFHGLLVITQGRTLLYDGPRATEVEHAGAETKILASGPDDAHPFVEIAEGGRVIRFAASGTTEAQLICAVIDLWTSSPEVAPDPRVRLGPDGVEIDDTFFVDTLRRTGHAVTPENMRSIHERFGMHLHGKALQHLGSGYGEGAGQQFMTAAGRPADDRALPGWPVRVLREWSSFNDGIAPVAVFFTLWVQNVLLETARTGGYLAHPGRPLSMWKNDQYDDGGRGMRRSMPA